MSDIKNAYEDEQQNLEENEEERQQVDSEVRAVLSKYNYDLYISMKDGIPSFRYVKMS